MIPLKLQRLLLFLFSCQVKSDSATPWTAAHHGLLSSTVSWSLLKFMSIESVVLYNYLILCFPLLLLLHSFPASGSFPISQLFTSGGQNIEASASATDLPMNIQGWFPLGLTALISFQTMCKVASVVSNSVWSYEP